MHRSIENSGFLATADVVAHGLNGTGEPAPRLSGNIPTNGHDAGTIDLIQLLREKSTRASRSSPMRLEFVAHGLAGCDMHVETATLISLIVEEAVVNAVRYAHPSGVAGIVKVACQRDSAGTLSIDVIDDGVGLPENFDPWKDGGSGFQIIRVLTARLGANLTFDSTSLGFRLCLQMSRISLESSNVGLTIVANDHGTEWATAARKQRKEMDTAALSMLTAIVKSSDDAILSKDLNGIITSWNAGAQRLFGYTAGEAVGKSVTMLIPDDRQDEEPEILGRIRRGERVKHYETIRVRKDGSLIDISLSVSPIKDEDGRVVGASKIARDISERKHAEMRQELLVHEINHRTKNLFAIIQSVVSKSFAGKSSVDEAKAAVLSRLHSLAQTNALLIEQDFHGADIRTIVDTEMSPYRERTEIEGPGIILSGQAAQNLALAVHELATNAAKYGALRTLSGKVRLNWKILDEGEARLFAFRWEEQGGPNVVAPARKGFGSTVLERVMAEYFDVRIDYAASGVVYEMHGPLDVIAAEK
jgi:PAS domain S-box-containing protein